MVYIRVYSRVCNIVAIYVPVPVGRRGRGEGGDMSVLLSYQQIICSHLPFTMFEAKDKQIREFQIKNISQIVEVVIVNLITYFNVITMQLM